MADLKGKFFNGATYNKVATIGKITALDHLGVALANGTHQVGTLPKGALITALYLKVNVAFDGTLPTISVGDTASPAKRLVATAVSSTGITVGSLLLNTELAAAEDLSVGLVAGGSTVGEAEVIVEYIDTENRTSMFTA